MLKPASLELNVEQYWPLSPCIVCDILPSSVPPANRCLLLSFVIHCGYGLLSSLPGASGDPGLVMPPLGRKLSMGAAAATVALTTGRSGAAAATTGGVGADAVAAEATRIAADESSKSNLTASNMRVSHETDGVSKVVCGLLYAYLAHVLPVKKICLSLVN